MQTIIGITCIVAPVLAAAVPEIIKAKGLCNLAAQFVEQIKNERQCDELIAAEASHSQKNQ